MESAKANKISRDVPTQVFLEFIESLRQAGAPAEMICRLEQICFNQQTSNEEALRAGIFGPE